MNITKFKLLKEMPDIKAGKIGKVIHRNGLFEDSVEFESDYGLEPTYFNLSFVQEKTNWFAPMLFTTEDGVDIYTGNEYFTVFSQSFTDAYGEFTEANKVYGENIAHCDKTGFVDYVKLFSTKQAAEKYLEPKFKVGDIVKYKFKFNTVIFKVGKVNKTSIISEDKESYETLLCTLANSEEIISYYEKLGWVKGAKFKWDKVLYEFTEFNFKRNGELLIMFDKQFGVKIKDCELIKNEYPKSWEDLESIEGWFFDFYSRKFHNNSIAPISVNKNLFKTEKQALSCLAYAQLSQLVAEMNGNEELDWENCSYAKFTIERFGSKLCKNQHTKDFKHLAFKTEEARDFSFQHHKNLWEKYWQI